MEPKKRVAEALAPRVICPLLFYALSLHNYHEIPSRGVNEALFCTGMCHFG